MVINMHSILSWEVTVNLPLHLSTKIMNPQSKTAFSKSQTSHLLTEMIKAERRTALMSDTCSRTWFMAYPELMLHIAPVSNWSKTPSPF